MDIKDIKQIRDLVSLMSNSDLSEITIEKKDIKLTLKREKAAPEPIAHQAQRPVEMVLPAAAAPQSPQPAAEPEAKPEPASDLHFITAPLVGTFYSSSSPDAPPYVKVGDKVKKGQILCIIEAMKLMNEIESDIDGEIVEVICENASPVEYGTKIFAIKKS